MRHFLLAGTCLLALCATAEAQNLISNGGFESANPTTFVPTGWTRTDYPAVPPFYIGSAAGAFGAYNASTVPATIGGSIVTAPWQPVISGTNSLLSNQNAPAAAAIWQAFTLPSAISSLTVRFNYAVNLYISPNSADVTQAALVRPSRLTAGGGTGASAADLVLLRVDGSGLPPFTFGSRSVPLTAFSATLSRAQLSSYLGQQIALSFFVGESTGPNTSAFDDVSVTWRLLALGHTPNQIAAATVLANAGLTGSPLGNVYNLLSTLPEAAQDGLLNRLGAPIHGDALLGGLADAQQFGASVAEQLYQRRLPGGTTAADAGVAELAGFTLWGQGYGGNFHTGAAGNTGSTASGGGFAAGLDREAAPGLRLGLAVGSAYRQTGSRGTGGSAEGTSTHLGPYLGYVHGPWFANAQAFGTFQEDSVKRDLGAGLGRAHGETSGLGGSGGVEAGRAFEVEGFRLEPVAGFRADRVTRNRSTETGSDLALQVAAGSATSARSQLGLRVSHEVPVAGLTATLTARAAWAHEFADPLVRTDASFLAGGESFRVASARTGREAAQLGVGAILPVLPGMALFARYSAELRSNYTAQSGTAGLRYSF